MQWIVKAFAIVMQKVMGASGAESLNVAASIFMGQTEAPLTIRPFLAGLTQSELFTIMVSGMAHVSGAVMAAYVLIRACGDSASAHGGDYDRARHHHAGEDLRSRKSDTPVTAGNVEVKLEKTAVNVIDAAAQGAGDGLHLCLNIAAMLIAFLSLIALVNGIFGWVHGWPAGFRPRWSSCSGWCLRLWRGCWACRGTIALRSGRLLGERLVTNEFIAFIDLGEIKEHLIAEVVHDRHVRVVRVRQLQFHRDSGGRDRRAGADAQIRPGADGDARRGGRHHGEFHVGLHCGYAGLSMIRRDRVGFHSIADYGRAAHRGCAGQRARARLPTR